MANRPKRDWLIYGVDRYGRWWPATHGGYTEQRAIEWAQASVRCGDARTCGFVAMLAVRGCERHEFPVPR